MPEAENLLHARRLFFFLKRKDSHSVRKFTSTYRLCDHHDVLAVFCKFFYPSVKESEHGISFIRLLCDDEEFHTFSAAATRRRSSGGAEDNCFKKLAYSRIKAARSKS